MEDVDPIQHGTKPRPPSILTVQWRSVAIGGVLVAIAALAALVVVATVNDAGALETIALSLAILAFVIQIVVFVAQAWTSSQQMLQSETLNAETKNLLVEVRSASSGTQSLLTDQFDRVLRAALERELPSVIDDETGRADQGDLGTATELQESLTRILQDVREGLAGATGATGPITGRTTASTIYTGGTGAAGVTGTGYAIPARAPATGQTEPSPSLDPEHQKVLDELATFPDREEGIAAKERLESLSPRAITVLKNFGDRERSARRNGDRGRLIASSPFSEELRAHGLLEPVEAPPGRGATGYMALTDLGRQTARLLTARRPYPHYMTEHEDHR
jgi:hypothetical protein